MCGGGAFSDHQPTRGPFFEQLASSSLPSSSSPEGRLLSAAAENSRLRAALHENNTELKRQMQVSKFIPTL